MARLAKLILPAAPFCFRFSLQILNMYRLILILPRTYALNNISKQKYRRPANLFAGRLMEENKRTMSIQKAVQQVVHLPLKILRTNNSELLPWQTL